MKSLELLALVGVGLGLVVLCAVYGVEVVDP